MEPSFEPKEIVCGVGMRAHAHYTSHTNRTENEIFAKNTNQKLVKSEYKRRRRLQSMGANRTIHNVIPWNARAAPSITVIIGGTEKRCTELRFANLNSFPSPNNKP